MRRRDEGFVEWARLVVEVRGEEERRFERAVVISERRILRKVLGRWKEECLIF